MRKTSSIAMAAVLGVLVLSAIASASASAEACKVKEGSGKYQLCINATRIAEPLTVPITSHTTAPLVIDLGAWSEGLTIECTTVAEPESHFSDNPTLSLSGSARPVLEGCSLKGNNAVAKKCILAGTKVFDSLAWTLESVGLIYVKPASGEAIWQWSLENQVGQTCPASAKGGHATIGSYDCVLQTPGVEAVEHELRCASSSHHRTYLAGLVESPLSYTQMISLGGAQKGAKFSVYESK